jgi:hypothetical protein
MTSGDVRLAGERGSALLIVLIAAGFVVPLVLSLALVAMSETALAASYSRALELRHAADSAADQARIGICAIDLRSLAPPGTEPVAALDAGGSLDLRREGAARQAESDTLYGAFPGNPDSPQWRLLQHGRLTDMLAVMLPAPAPYVAVWIADDPADGDGNPLVDTNGRLEMIGAAYTNRGSVGLVQRVVSCVPAPPQRAARVVFSGDWP